MSLANGAGHAAAARAFHIETAGGRVPPVKRQRIGKIRIRTPKSPWHSPCDECGNQPTENPMRRNHLTILALALALHAVAGCSVAKLQGEVDGEHVPSFHTGMIFEANKMTSDDDIVAVAAFYSFSGGCDVVAEQTDVKADGIQGLGAGDDAEELIDEVRSFEEDNLPEEYWAAYVVLAGKNESDIEDDFDIQDDVVAVTVCHHTGAVDAPREDPAAALLPDFAAPFFKDANRECFGAEEGEVRVSLYDGKSISLVAEVELVDDEGDDAGEVELGGLGAHCAPVQDAMDGLFDEYADLMEAYAPSPSGGSGCPYANDGECDEPNGTNLCEYGTDGSDC